MNRRFLLCMIFAAALSVFAAVGADARACPDYVRLHVLANDDTPGAQALKLRVKDACLLAAGEILAGCESADGAWSALRDDLPGLNRAALREARRQGFSGEVRVQAGVFDFPDREYGGMVVPAGRYRAVRVIIGEGAGRNWWCVLYPSLCMPEDYEPGMEIEFYSSVVQWLRRVFGGGDT